MAQNPDQKLILLDVDPGRTRDLTPILEKFDWWGEGWTIQQVSLSPYGATHVMAAVVLTRGRQESIGGNWVR